MYAMLCKYSYHAMTMTGGNRNNPNQKKPKKKNYQNLRFWGSGFFYLIFFFFLLSFSRSLFLFFPGWRMKNCFFCYNSGMFTLFTLVLFFTLDVLHTRTDPNRVPRQSLVRCQASMDRCLSFPDKSFGGDGATT
ncbi:hypothetical protein BDV28DRAFT_11102 [Aspergillus coremiiformis]|uniref:Uncharacterized protein n=1 Tax=Aspergillus coremiiformis TaxID=138285 RepID=A0A5N6Z2I8_9EURO|nr:hypothetical protein BDV28DRAFT_11102 [Aspergillus coremiiformis]